MARIVFFLALLGFVFPAFSSTYFSGEKVQRKAIPNQHIVQFVTSSEIPHVFKLAEVLEIPFLQMAESEREGAVRILLNQSLGGSAESRYKTLVYFDKSNIDSQTWQAITNSAQVIAVYPNYRYTGELREDDVEDPDIEEPQVENPNDEKFEDQYHHPVMENTLAWSLLAQPGQIVVAVTDDGVDYDHEDLKDNIYINEKEIPGNNIDDDENGYIDDVRGWDFADDDNNPYPSMGSHGTHVAGIVAAVADNGVGVAGTAAPVAKIMPLRFYNGFSFTSATVAETYKYAADNGANIITTSYNIDFFVGDQVFEEAIAYVYDKGVLHFNSAGNGYTSGPSRRAFQELILVCSTKARPEGNEFTDQKNEFSNYGPGVDLCAPGGDILSTVPNNKYERQSGTSMAAPNAAAVAALIWAQNPTWTRDQVVAQLLSTSENVDDKNPDFVGQLGAGRVNSHLALSTPVLQAPQFDSIDELQEEKAVKGTKQFSVRFTHLLDPATVQSQAFGLYGKDGKIPVSVDRAYKAGSNEVVLSFEELDAGDYTLYVRPSLKDPFGRELDGNGDGTPGDEKVIAFTVEN